MGDEYLQEQNKELKDRLYYSTEIRHDIKNNISAGYDDMK